MAIHVVLGKPGSGKSRYVTGKVIQELREGKRNIVTNLPLNLGRLNEYLQETYPKEDIRVLQRVRIMTDDEMRRFWTIRGQKDAPTNYPEDLPPFLEWYKGFPFEEGQQITQDLLERVAAHKESARQQYDTAIRDLQRKRTEWISNFGTIEGTEGVVYFLDEAHIAFNARDWATFGREALHYLSQHRKLGDDVWPITQAPGNLDKQFRSVAQDFTVLKNDYKARYSIFKGRGRFVWKSYNQEPSGNMEPFMRGTFELDPTGIASCYDTARGIGVHGSKADIGVKAGGISIWWAAVGVLVLVSSILWVPKLLSGVVASKMDKSGKRVEAKGNMEKPHQQAKVNTVVSQPQPAIQKPQVPEVTVIAYAFDGRGPIVWLSDGTIHRRDTIKAVYQNAVEMTDGTMLKFAARKPPPASDAAHATRS